MNHLLEPIKSDTLVEVFVQRFEELILSGKLSIGQRLPSERELAVQLGVSRPVVHEGLLDLEVKGLVAMKPRVGTVVNDYRREGSLTLLNSLVNYHQGDLDPRLFESLLQLRYLVETEAARLAAINRIDEQVQEFRELLNREDSLNIDDRDAVTEVDFRFHLLVAIASGNAIYPLLMNSFKQVYTNLTWRFFSDKKVIATVFSLHRAMVDAMESRDVPAAESVMKRIIEHGEIHLKQLMKL